MYVEIWKSLHTSVDHLGAKSATQENKPVEEQ